MRQDARLAERSLLEFLNRFGPVGLEESRHRPIGKYLAVGLTSRAVVGFILSVDDPLHRRAALWAWLSKPAVNGHAGAKCRHLFRECTGRFLPQTVDPLKQSFLDGAEKVVGFRLGEFLRHAQRRHSGAVQDLI